jgi:hypothetical protein
MSGFVSGASTRRAMSRSTWPGCLPTGQYIEHGLSVLSYGPTPSGLGQVLQEGPRSDESPAFAGPSEERMKGLEPSTFCMAIGMA